MNEQLRRTQRWLWVGLTLTLGTLFLAFLLAHLRMRALSRNPLPVWGTVAQFHLTNQLGQAVSLDDLRGHIWIADVIFTRCMGPCLKMSRQMKDLQDELSRIPNVRLISITTDPHFDLPPVLNTYAQGFGADSNRWLFLTGSQPEIANLVSNSLKLASMEKQPKERESAADLYQHTTIFVIIDKKAQLRGSFETTGEGIDARQAKTKILAAIRQLERER